MNLLYFIAAVAIAWYLYQTTRSWWKAGLAFFAVILALPLVVDQLFTSPSDNSGAAASSSSQRSGAIFYPLINTNTISANRMTGNSSCSCAG